MTTLAAYVLVSLTTAAAAFQIALASGAPWGELAMGGKYPGRFPPALRAFALVQMTVLVGIACIALARSGLAFVDWHAWSRTLIWVVVAISALSSLANLATPSRWERILWAPVALGMLASSLVLAMAS